jgi:hypothetical protein
MFLYQQAGLPVLEVQKISAESLKPKDPGLYGASKFPGIFATKISRSAKARKKSSRTSRGWNGLILSIIGSAG